MFRAEMKTLFSFSLTNMLVLCDNIICRLLASHYFILMSLSDFSNGFFRDTLMSIAKHYETGESLPEEVYLKLLAARTFRAGSLSLRQVSAFGWCYFFLPCNLWPFIFCISFGNSDVILVLGLHFNSCFMLSGI